MATSPVSSAFASVNEVKAGSRLRPDNGFCCMAEGEIKTVFADDQGRLYVTCSAGQHFIDGQLDDVRYVGLYLAE